MTAIIGNFAGLLATAGGVQRVTFAVAAFIVIVGAIGVIASRSPVHSALMLVMTFFGIAVLFITEDANFLAAVQVIVYAGAIVVLFLFVIMFLGVDKDDDVDTEPLRGQRPLAVLLVVLGLGGVLLLGISAKWGLGASSVSGPVLNQPGGDVAALGRAVFTTYLFPFEATAGLLLIAVVGAVVLARRPKVDSTDIEPEEIGVSEGGPSATSPAASVSLGSSPGAAPDAAPDGAPDAAPDGSVDVDLAADEEAHVGAVSSVSGADETVLIEEVPS